MTSEARETSMDSGQPVAFFRFTRDTRSWCYTGSDRAEDLLGDSYLPAAIARSAIKQGSERAKLSIKVTLPSSLAVAENWRPYSPTQPIGLTCFVRHVGEADALVEWVGRVTASSFEGAELVLTCEPSQTRSRRLGAQRCWQRGCGLVLYSQGLGQCNLAPGSVAAAATLTAVSGLTLTAEAFGLFPSGRLAGGYVEWLRADGLAELRSIRSHTGSSIVLDYGATDLAVGLALTAYPGCAHTWADCGYYRNQANYGGDLWMPTKNPFDGNPVW